MLAKLITREGYEFRVDPLEVTGIVGLDRTADGERTWVYTRQNSQCVIGSVEQVEAALAQARRLKLTGKKIGPMYVQPQAVKGVWMYGDQTYVALGESQEDSWAVMEPLAEVLAALDWAE